MPRVSINPAKGKHFLSFLSKIKPDVTLGWEMDLSKEEVKLHPEKVKEILSLPF